MGLDSPETTRGQREVFSIVVQSGERSARTTTRDARFAKHPTRDLLPPSYSNCMSVALIVLVSHIDLF